MTTQALTAEIVERTIGGDTDKRLQIAGGHYVRKLDVGSDWTKLRLGFMLSNNRASDWSTAPYYYIGLMSGTANPPGSASPSHSFGICSKDGWQYSSGTNRIISNGSATANRVYVCEGGSLSTKTATSADYLYTLSPASGSAPLIIEIEKGSPNYTIKAWGCDYSSVASSTIGKFNDAMQAPTTETSGGPFVLLRLVTHYTYAIDESTYGYLDTVCFSWLGEGASNAFEISDIAVRRLA